MEGYYSVSFSLNTVASRSCCSPNPKDVKKGVGSRYAWCVPRNFFKNEHLEEVSISLCIITVYCLKYGLLFLYTIHPFLLKYSCSFLIFLNGSVPPSTSSSTHPNLPTLPLHVSPPSSILRSHSPAPSRLTRCFIEKGVWVVVVGETHHLLGVICWLRTCLTGLDGWECPLLVRLSRWRSGSDPESLGVLVGERSWRGTELRQTLGLVFIISTIF